MRVCEYLVAALSALWQCGSVDNYWGQPITMGGTKADGTTEYNSLSCVILDVMDECILRAERIMR